MVCLYSDIVYIYIKDLFYKDLFYYMLLVTLCEVLFFLFSFFNPNNLIFLALESWHENTEDVLNVDFRASKSRVVTDGIRA